MKEIEKIVIKSESGYVPYEDAYADRLSLTQKGNKIQLSAHNKASHKMVIQSEPFRV